MEKVISQLRTFFEISTAGVVFMETILKATGNEPKHNEMYELHKLAHEELQKENPDIAKMDSLLEKMQLLAERQNQAQFAKGCKHINSKEEIISKRK